MFKTKHSDKKNIDKQQNHTSEPADSNNLQHNKKQDQQMFGNNSNQDNKQKANSTIKNKDSGKSGADNTDNNMPQQIQDLQHQIKELTTQTQTLKEQLLKSLADYKNYQSRVEARKKQEKLLLKREVFKDIILLFENLHIALDMLQPELKDHPDIKGIVLIVEQYKDLLKKHGVTEITYKQGDVVDISSTEIIGSEPTPNNKQKLKGRVAKLITPGYKIGDIIIKQARVIVFG